MKLRILLVTMLLLGPGCATVTTQIEYWTTAPGQEAAKVPLLRGPPPRDAPAIYSGTRATYTGRNVVVSEGGPAALDMFHDCGKAGLIIIAAFFADCVLCPAADTLLLPLTIPATILRDRSPSTS